MRPDEHKKKKNAAYKKKHGITTGTSDWKEGKPTREKEISTGDRKIEPPTKSGQASKNGPSSATVSLESLNLKFKGGKGKVAGVVASEVKLENKSSGSDSSSDTKGETSNKKKSFKSFRRREIVSNWQKYELQPNEEEKISARGENYEKLLSMAGETISHFRFKDELAWDDPADSTHENSSNADSNLLSVNPSELVQSLACLPVYQVLGISQDVFPDEQLSSMMNMVKDRRSVYDAEVLLDEKGAVGHMINSARKNGTLEASQNPRHLLAHEDDQENNLLSLFKVTTEDQEAACPSTSKEKIAGITTSFTTSNASVNSHGCQNDYTSTDIVAKKVFGSDKSDITKKLDEKLPLKDDDLDTGLGFDNPETDVAGDFKERSRKKLNTIAASSLPITDAISLIIQSSTSNIDSKLATESSDLEAWLDSILED